MATYVLMCTAKLGTSVAENEGVFDSVNWVSPTETTLPDPASAALSVQPNDQIGFAIQVYDASNTLQNSLLSWVSVSVSASTAPGDRNTRYADNNSPFRIGSGNRPNTVLLASNQGGSAAQFGAYQSNGQPATSGNTQALGTQPANVVADVPPGASAPTRATSQYEAVVTCSITDAQGQLWQFTFDPEVDVENGN